jgi:hypothetical protein
MRQRFGVGDVVYGDEFNAIVAEGCTQDVAADAAESVDSDFDGHKSSERIRKYTVPPGGYSDAQRSKMLWPNLANVKQSL